MDSNQPNFPTEPPQPQPSPELQPESQSVPSQPQPMSPVPPVPVTPQQPGFATAPVSPQPPKKSKKGLIIGGIVAGALVIFGGIGALAYNVWYQNPEKVIFDALSNAFKAKSVTGEGKLVVKSDSVDVEVTFNGESKGSDGKINTKVKLDGKSAGRSLTVDVTASLLVKGDTIYFKLDNVRKTVDTLSETLGEVPEYFDPIINKIDGQWVSVKASDYEDVSKEVAEQQRCVTNLFDDLSNNDSMKRELINLYKENRIMVIDERLSPKKVNGVGSLGYEVSADRAATKSFIEGLADTEFGKGLAKCDDSVDFAEAAEAIKEDDDQDSDANGKLEIWVSRFGHQITEIRVTGDSDDTTGSFVFNPTFNTDVSIEAPSDAITLKQLQEDIEKAMEEYTSSLFSQDMYNDYDFDDELDYEEYQRYNLN